MGGGREAASSSPLYRGFLYSCITRVLHTSLSTSLESQRGQESEEGKGYEGGRYGYSDMMSLEQCAGELTDTLGSDCARGPPVWRVVALSALSAVLTTLGPFRDRTGESGESKNRSKDICPYPSTGYLQALQALSFGHVLIIMNYIGLYIESVFLKLYCSYFVRVKCLLFTLFWFIPFFLF
jgi:hypothetical protein